MPRKNRSEEYPLSSLPVHYTLPAHMTLPEDKQRKIYSLLFFVILVIGLYLRFYQYFMGRSLWEDEAHLALNFINRDFAGILKPLDNIQAAPPLFLLSVKMFTALFGCGAKALRALPFIFSILTLPLFYYIILDFTKNRIVALTGFLIFSVNLAVIYFSSELKTYGIDVAMYLVLVWLMVSQNKTVAARRNLLLAIAGSVFALYSNITFIMLFCIGCVMLAGWIKNKKIVRTEMGVLLAWAVVYIAYYFASLYHHPYQSIQVTLYAFAFPPKDIFSKQFYDFIHSGINETAFSLLLYVSPAYGFGWVLLLIFITAIVSLLRRKKYILLWFALAPLLIHFALSYLRVYPFWYRFTLYLMPGLMLLMAWGTYVIAAFIARKTFRIAGAIVFIICCAFFITPSVQGFPLWYREIGPVLNHINTNYTGIKLYVTTPLTLYKYSYQTGAAKDSLYEALEWNIAPEAYFMAVAGNRSDYLLLHAADPGTDGYGRVVQALREKKLIIDEFTYKTYTVDLVRPLNSDGIALNCNSFDKERIFDLDGKKVTALWDNAPVSTKTMSLPKGKYTMTIISKGTPATGIYPHIHVLVNDEEIDNYTTPAEWKEQQVIFSQEADTAQLKLIMDNDFPDAATKEDRNAFISNVLIRKTNSSK